MTYDILYIQYIYIDIYIYLYIYAYILYMYLTKIHWIFYDLIKMQLIY